MLNNSKIDNAHSLFKRFLIRIKLSPGREYEQAFLRLIIGCSVFIYTVYLNRDHPEVILHVASEIILYLSAGIILLIWIFKDPVKTPLRYVTSSVIDITGLSYAMFIGDGLGAALYPLFLWVIFGFGFRFGRRYLFLASAESIIGFFIVYSYSTYWQQHQVLFNGLLLGLMILPLYVSVLLKNLEKNIEIAKIASKAKSQFLSNMSHELRTPLNGIVGSNDLLKNSDLTNEQHKYVNTIEYSVTTLLGLIENILDLSKIESGKKEVLHEPFDLHYLLNSTLQMLKPHAVRKNLTLKLEVSADVPYSLIGDSNLTRQVLVNLIGNAIKYTNKGSVTVRVSLKNKKDNICNVFFEIIDTGLGIEKDKLNVIFDRFSQVDDSDTRTFEGAGLGTAIAKEVVQCLGGEIGVDSEYHEGSDFWFEVPYEINSLDRKHDTILKGMRIIVINNGKQHELCKKLADDGAILFEIGSDEDIGIAINKALKDNESIHAIINSESLNTRLLIRESNSNIYLKNTSLIFISQDVIDMDEINHGYNFILPISVDEYKLLNALHSSPSFFEYNESNKERIKGKNNIVKNNLNILLAEDDYHNQKLFEMMLNKGGHSVTIASNGQEALDELAIHSYDLCIIDMQMPIMGGVQAIKNHRELNPNNTIPFIMLTANATTEAIEKCKKVGVDMFLTKPIRSTELLNAVNSINMLKKAM